MNKNIATIYENRKRLFEYNILRENYFNENFFVRLNVKRS